jgi:hypothetical protein
MASSKSNKSSLKTLSMILKAIAAITGIGIIAGAFIGLPFMLKESSYLSSVAITIVCLFAGPLYIFPNSYLLKNRVIFFVFVAASSSFLALGILETYSAVVNNRSPLSEVMVGMIACISAPTSLYFYWLNQKRNNGVAHKSGDDHVQN